MKKYYDRTNYFNRMIELQDELNSSIQTEKVVDQLQKINDRLENVELINDLEDVTNKPFERRVRTLVDDQQWENYCENENKRDREDSDDGDQKKKRKLDVDEFYIYID